MQWTSIFSFLKHNKDGLKSLDQLPISSPHRSSAWSYSYDLNVNERWEAVMDLDNKSIDSESDAEHYISKSQLNLNEDLHNEFIFQENTQHQEHAAKPHILIPAKVKSDESLSNVELLRLSNVQKQRSWSERLTSPFQNDTSSDVTTAVKRPCKSQIDIPVLDYLWQFVQKTALPLIRDYEQLRKRYSREKKEWKKHVEFLERQISIGRSMWRDANIAYRDALKELLSIQKILSQSRGMKGNFKRDVPVLSERRRTHDSNLELQAIPEPQNTVETEEFVNVKPDVHRDVEYLDLRRKVIKYEDLIFSEHSQNIHETNTSTVTRNLRPILLEPLPRIRVSRESKNTIVSDSHNNLKVGNTVFVTVNGERLLGPDIEESSSDENSTLAEHDVDRTKAMFSVKASTDLIAGRRKTAKDVATDYEHNVNEWSIDSWDKQDVHKLKEKNLPKTVFIDPHLLTLSDSWNIKNQDETISSRKRRVIKEDKENSLINSPDMSKSSAHQTIDSISQYQRGGGIFNKNMPRIAIRSKWL